MVDWTTVVISVVGGTLSGLWQVNQSYKNERRIRIEKETEDWYHRVNSLCLRIRREALRLPSNEPIKLDGYRPESDSSEVDLSRLNELIDRLMDAHTEAPAEIDRGLLQNIESLGFEYENIEPEMAELSTTDIREFVKLTAEEVMDEVSEYSERYEETPY